MAQSEFVESDFVKHINTSFTEIGILNKQQSYLLGDLNKKFSPLKKSIHNHFHIIFRHFDVLPTFLFTTSETMGDYYL